MNILEQRNLSVIEFKKKYPKLYIKIKNFYSSKTKIFDIHAAINLYFNNKLIPKCEICEKNLSITDKFRNISPSDRNRCSAHVNTSLDISYEQLVSHSEKYSIKNIKPYYNNSDKLILECPTHGEYTQQVNYFLQGGSCQKCYHESKIGQGKFTLDEWKIKANKKFNNFYDYSLVEFTTLNNLINIECPIHGVFQQQAGLHIRGHGCKKCSTEILSQKLTFTNLEFIEKANKIHANKYDYSVCSYTGSREKVKIICPTHGEFSQVAYYHLAGNGCQTCGIMLTTYKSSAEYEIIDFLKNHGITNIVHSDRRLGFELDIFLPDHNLAIEYNGIYWHSTNSQYNINKFKNQHVFKTDACNQKNIDLLHILDLEWNDEIKKEIWKSMILNRLGKNNKLYARKCLIREVPVKQANTFFLENHMQGYAVSKINIGLFYQNELIACASFSKSRFSKTTNTYELIRFSTIKNYVVVGAFSKLITNFIDNHLNQGDQLISYANRRWSQGKVYLKNNFVLVSTTAPCYYYTNCRTLWHRTKFQKHKLKKILSSYNENLSESENMFNNNFRKIWDCGHYVFKLIK